MTVDEIFGKLAQHMIEGVAYHDELVKAFDFLGWYGFAKCHEWHYFEESKGYRELMHYYATHYHKILQLEPAPKGKLISDSWYKYTTMAVDSGTKRQALKTLMESWINWEKETKKLYEEMFQELTNLREVAAADEVRKYICDVTDELKHAEKKLIKLETLGYDAVTIVEWQQPMYRKFKDRLKNLF